MIAVPVFAAGYKENNGYDVTAASVNPAALFTNEMEHEPGRKERLNAETPNVHLLLFHASLGLT